MELLSVMLWMGFHLVSCVKSFCLLYAEYTMRDEQDLKQNAPILFLLFHLQGGPRCRFEHLANAFLRFGRALQICESVDLLEHRLALRRLHRLLFHLGELFDCVRIISEIFFVTD